MPFGLKIHYLSSKYIKMKIALVCIAKNEDNYIEEWINYHLKLGFNKIFIYENDWRCNIDNENIVKIPHDGHAKQYSAYNHFIQNYNKEYDWAAFFDVDEYLVLHKHKTIKSFIKKYGVKSSIAINWVLFGDNNIKEVNNNYNIISRFTKRQDEVNIHIKVISKLRNDIVFNLPHNTNREWIDTCGNIGRGPFNRNCNIDVAQLNHYFCKTYPEFIEKVKRGRSDIGTIRDLSDFERHNFNEIEDLSAFKFFYD